MITYVKGDATRPVGDSGQKVIAHICNDIGGWGSGFVLALSRRSTTAENAYRLWHRSGFNGAAPFRLGEVQIVNYLDGIWVANMIAQHGVRHDERLPPAVRYDALDAALDSLAGYALRGVGVPSIHMPRIGCGLGGGSWDRVEPLIEKNLTGRDIPVTVYDLEQGKD